MKDKDKELLLGKIAKLEEQLKNYPHLNAEFPEIDKTLSLLHKKVAYAEVLDEQGGLVIFGRGKLKDLANFTKHIDQFVQGMQKLSIAPNLTSKLLTAEVLHNGENNIAAGLKNIKAASDPMFENALDAMISYVGSVTGGINPGELVKELQKLALKEFEMIDTEALKRTTSMDAVEEMKIPVLKNYFFADYESSYENSPSLKVPSATEIVALINNKFASAYVMSEKDFEADLSKWVEHMKTDIAKLASHPFGKCEIAIDMIAKDCMSQIKTVSAQNTLFSKLQLAMNKAIMSIVTDNIPTLSDFVAKAGATLDQIKAVSATLISLQNVNEPNFFSNRLIPIVTLSVSAVNRINTNSPYYITGQPNFSANLTQKLNDWKETISTALGVASKTVLGLDGGTFSAAKFKTSMLQGFSTMVPELSNVFNALVLKDIKLKEHKDLATFNAQWELPWRSLVTTIDINKFLQNTAPNPQLQAMLYTNMYDILPSQDDVLTAFLSCVSGKTNSTLDAVIKSRQEMQAGFANVENKLNVINQNVLDVKSEVHEIHGKVDKILDNTNQILKKLDNLPNGDTNINIDMEVNVDNLLNVVEKTDKKITVKIEEKLNEYLKKFDREYEFFQFDRNIPLATFYSIFTAYAKFGAKMNAKLNNRIVGTSIESTGNVKLEAYAGLGLAAFTVLGCSLAAVEGILKAVLNGEAKAKLAISSDTKLEGGLQASLTLFGKAEVAFLVLEKVLYKIESSDLNIFVIKTPIYAIGFQVSDWKYLGASSKGNWQCEMHPDLKAHFKKAYEVLTDVGTWAEAGMGKLVDFASDVYDSTVEFGESIVDGVGDLIDYFNPF
jgi:hypothetical protein